MKNKKKIVLIALCVLLLAGAVAASIAGSRRETARDASGTDDSSLSPQETSGEEASGSPWEEPTHIEGLQYLKGSSPAPAPEAGPVGDAFRKAYASLAAELLKRCRDGEGDQVLVSPLSVLTALTMTANGADGETLAQMERVLGGGMEIAELNRQLFRFYAGLSSAEDAFFSSANSVWVSPHFRVEDGFLNTVGNLYFSEVIRKDFTESDAAELVNRWCEANTKEMIREVVTPDDFSVDTMLLLVNALCFDAKWEQQYDEENEILKGVFRGTDGEQEDDFLYGIEWMDYLEGETETGFVKPYKGGKYAFAALLPKSGGLSAYLKTLDGGKWLSLLENAETCSVETKIPVFRQESDLKLKDALTAMGMTDAFTGDADFAPMGVCDDGSAVKIGKVIHKTFLELNNEGTRAAAVTAVIMERESFEVGDKTVVLDQPFVYAIIDVSTGLPIFFGTCENVK